MINKHNYTSFCGWIIRFLGVISSFLDGVKLHLPKRVAGLARSCTQSFGVVLPFLPDIITLARCVILEVSKCIIPILHYFSRKYTILLRLKVHLKSLCNNTHKKNGYRGWQQFYTIFKCNFTLPFWYFYPCKMCNFTSAKLCNTRFTLLCL